VGLDGPLVQFLDGLGVSTRMVFLDSALVVLVVRRMILGSLEIQPSLA
jgi:hypothetical protein